MRRLIPARLLIWGARAFSLVTGRVPDPGSWPIVWGNSRRYAVDRWQKRDATFERRSFDYDDALAFLTQTRRGAARDFREGSIPRSALEVITRHMGSLPAEKPLRGLHIGNFVGVSLASVTDAARRLHPESVVMSIDPNIPHRGVDSPHDLVTALMTRYGLQANWLPITAFTLDRSGLVGVLNRKSGTTPHFSYYGFAATQALRNLERLGLKFDFVLIDGNHNEGYLRREVSALMGLVRPGGILFFDDVDENWEGVTAVFEGLDPSRFRRVAHEDRIGVVRRLRGAGEGPAGRIGGQGGKGKRGPAARRQARAEAFDQ